MAKKDTNHKEEYVILLDLLAKANNSVEESSISDDSERERLFDAHNLANKFIGHALTILHLLNDTHVLVLPSFPPIRIISVVSASIVVLTRTTMEAFLTFHYVFFAPRTKEEKDYRYLCHKAAGIVERQNLPEGTHEQEQQRADEKKALEQFCDKLESNVVFQNLTEKQKASFFAGKEPNMWRWNPNTKKFLSWEDIGIDAGLSKMIATHMYRYIAGYAHSGSLSVLQTTQILINKEPQILIPLSINTMNIIIANMIHEYCGLFPKAQDILTKDLGGNNLVEQYIQIGYGLDKYMGTQVGQ